MEELDKTKYDFIEECIKGKEEEANKLVQEYRNFKQILIFDYILLGIWLIWGWIKIWKKDLNVYDYACMWITLILSLHRSILHSKIGILNAKIKIIDFINLGEIDSRNNRAL